RREFGSQVGRRGAGISQGSITQLLRSEIREKKGAEPAARKMTRQAGRRFYCPLTADGLGALKIRQVREKITTHPLSGRQAAAQLYFWRFTHKNSYQPNRNGRK
ncbi:MAG: hypothetical protein WAW69_13155, partial [Polaromonas sp.]